MIKIRNHHIFNNGLHGYVISQKLPVDRFKWVEKKSKFNEDFIKYFNEDSDLGWLFQVDGQNPETLHELYNDLKFFQE